MPYAPIIPSTQSLQHRISWRLVSETLHNILTPSPPPPPLVSGSRRSSVGKVGRYIGVSYIQYHITDNPRVRTRYIHIPTYLA